MVQLISKVIPGVCLSYSCHLFSLLFRRVSGCNSIHPVEERSNTVACEYLSDHEPIVFKLLGQLALLGHWSLMLCFKHLSSIVETAVTSQKGEIDVLGDFALDHGYTFQLLLPFTEPLIFKFGSAKWLIFQSFDTVKRRFRADSWERS
ncbi:hypothetical protein AKJ16_DCAP16291 [Drosera capensis]